jgi:hypothetical protein
MGMTPTLEQHLDDQDMNDRAVVDSGTDAFNPLLMRMQALHLDPHEVMRMEAGVFGYLADACAQCTSKGICARGLSSATVTRDWETYCPNAAILRAMTVLPWFAKASSGPNCPAPATAWQQTKY